MSDIAIASAVVMADTEIQQRPSSQNGLKRRPSEEAEQESKRQRRSPGKTSPQGTRVEEQHPAKHDARAESKPTEKLGDGRRKSGVVDEKKRSKRLFGALLGNLNQPSDRAAKRRQEIEERRKAELQRQDDERLEDVQRRLDRLSEQRKRAQKKVDEQNMHIRHRHMLSTANFLRTSAEPKLYYRPWDLRADEEDRVEDQIREAQAQVDKELVEFQDRSAGEEGAGAYHDEDHPMAGTEADDADQAKEEFRSGHDGQHVGVQSNEDNEDSRDKSEVINDGKPTQAPESNESNDNSKADDDAERDKQVEEERNRHHELDEGDHVVEGDEDTIIY